jgi:hypothetical protein
MSLYMLGILVTALAVLTSIALAYLMVTDTTEIDP